MFLNSLSPKEKDAFMKLAVAVIKADGIVKETENQILSAYANEMQISICDLNEQSDFDNAVKTFTESSTTQIKRIVFLELLALAFADGEYATEEKVLIQRFADTFDFDNTFIERAINLADAYTSAYMSLIYLVEKGE